MDSLKNQLRNTPPNGVSKANDLPILQKITQAYIQWHAAMRQMEKLSRYTLGAKIDNLFTETLELILYAAYANEKQKLLAVQKTITKHDALKYFLQIAWQIKALDHKTYARISSPLEETGKMLGGWLKHVQ